MELSRPWQIARDTLAVLVTGIFMFPIFWWALTSIKPISAVFDKDKVVWFNFKPTLINYAVTLLGRSRSQLAIDDGLGMGVAGTSTYDARQSIVESIYIAMGSTAITMTVAVLAAYALSRMRFPGHAHFLNWVLGQRFMPPIAILVPIVVVFKNWGMRESDYLRFPDIWLWLPGLDWVHLLTGFQFWLWLPYFGWFGVNMGYIALMLIYALANLPIAVLLMKSFFDDVPKDVDEAAMIDGATRWQCFRKVVLPMIRGGVAASAVLVFIFSWTEFLFSLFLTSGIRTVPVKIQTFVTSTGNEWGFITALGTASVIPGFIFILLVQRHLVRGLTLGSLKE